MFRVTLISVFCILAVSSIRAEDSVFAFQPIVNELSLYENFLDNGDNAGQTLQIVSINSLKVYTEFSFEFTADFNRKMVPGTNSDYYIEMGIVKPVWKKVSANYQRIYGTFIDKPINQVGVRYSF
ncbi:MAG: hypothetical protein GY839_15215 [candidate division Zixibacteria bacterium]|nr:hypothetical protein [candidate division Zixibacteria bacterium]